MNRLFAILLLLSLGSISTQAEETTATPQVKTLEQLLAKVRAEQQQQQALSRQREAEFLKERDKQQQLLDKARAAFAQTQSKLAPSRALAEAKAAEITRLQRELDTQVKDMGDIYSVYRQFATDFAAVLNESPVGAEYPDRATELARINNPDNLPSIEDMEKLWYLVQEEMTASGQVNQYKGKIVEAAGNARDTNIVRIGNFTAFSEDEFLRYVPETSELIAPEQQPDSHLRSAAEDFADSQFTENKGELTGAPIDPTRGNLLGMLAHTPTLIERIHQGGIVGYLTIAVGLLGLAITFWRTAYLLNIRKAVNKQLVTISQPRSDNPLGRIIQSANQAKVKDEETLQYTLDEAVLKEIPRLEYGHSVIKLFAAIGPMLGLLGTVTGMIKTFEAISLFGGGDPKLMAAGISEALVCTVLGLLVAVPLLFGHNTVTSLAKSLIQQLDEQSAGILARALEKKSS